MGMALEVLTGIATAPSTTATALTMAAGNSATVRNTGLNTRVELLQAWFDVQAAGFFRIRSPNLHDNVQGIRWNTIAASPMPLMPRGLPQKLIPQDSLVLEITGSATGGDIETACLLVWYEDLPGVSARFIDKEMLMRRVVNVVTVQNTLALGTAGGYSGEEAINAEFDQFKANTDYAILGMVSNITVATIRYRGSDTGNLGLGVPGLALQQEFTASWFIWLSESYQRPLIPVFNSANKDNLLIDGATDENGTDAIVTTVLAELAPTV